MRCIDVVAVLSVSDKYVGDAAREKISSAERSSILKSARVSVAAVRVGRVRASSNRFFAVTTSSCRARCYSMRFIDVVAVLSMNDNVCRRCARAEISNAERSRMIECACASEAAVFV